MTLASCLATVRDYLRAYDQSLWRDSEIQAYIQRGYEDFATKTHYFRKYAQDITIANLTMDFTLPTELLMPYRFEWDNRVCLIVTTNYMDWHFGAGWRISQGARITHIIGDAGVYTKMLAWPLMTTANIGTYKLKCDYAYMPAALSSSVDIDLSDAIARCLAHYATAMCLRMNAQSNMNVPLADMHFQIYSDELARVKALADAGRTIRLHSRVRPKRYI